MTDNDYTIDELRTMLDHKLNHHGVVSDHQLFQVERKLSLSLCDTVAKNVKRIAALESEIKRLKGEV